jgi:hypothetical protein
MSDGPHEHLQFLDIDNAIVILVGVAHHLPRAGRKIDRIV